MKILTKKKVGEVLCLCFDLLLEISRLNDKPRRDRMIHSICAIAQTVAGANGPEMLNRSMGVELDWLQDAIGEKK